MAEVTAARTKKVYVTVEVEPRSENWREDDDIFISDVIGQVLGGIAGTIDFDIERLDGTTARYRLISTGARTLIDGAPIEDEAQVYPVAQLAGETERFLYEPIREGADYTRVTP